MAAVNANALQVFADLRAEGLPAGAAAGVVGNLIAESGVNPNGPAGDNGTSHGIAQWHNQRWTQMVTWARAKGLDPRSLRAQTGYLVAELKAMNLWGKLQQTTDPNAAAATVMLEFERPASKDPTGRQNLARQVYAAATGGNVPAPSTGGGTSSSTPQSTTQGVGLASSVVSGVRPLLVEAGFLALAGGLVVLGLSKTFQSQISGALGAVGKVVP